MSDRQAELVDQSDADGREAAVLAAHAAGDTAALARLYRQSGLHAEALGDTAQACFLITMAYVNALDAGLDETTCELKAWLVARGRETDDSAAQNHSQ